MDILKAREFAITKYNEKIPVKEITDQLKKLGYRNERGTITKSNVYKMLNLRAFKCPRKNKKNKSPYVAAPEQPTRKIDIKLLRSILETTTMSPTDRIAVALLVLQ